jgi:hypothetical protein
LPPIDEDRIAALIDAYNQGIGIAEGAMPDLLLKLTEAQKSRIWAVFKQLDHKLRNKEMGRNECLREAYAACGELPYKSAIALLVSYGRSLEWLPAYRNIYGQVKCRVCGCTDRYSCNPPCNWVEEDLCSTCLEAARALLHRRESAVKPDRKALWMELNRLYLRSPASSALAPALR